MQQLQGSLDVTVNEVHSMAKVWEAVNCGMIKKGSLEGKYVVAITLWCTMMAPRPHWTLLAQLPAGSSWRLSTGLVED
jgi:hypothetical protein